MSRLEGERTDAVHRLRTRIKVCGITRPDDARMAVELGADALGIILVKESPRYMGDRPDVLREIAATAGPYVPMVAVVRYLEEAAHLPAGLFQCVQYYEGNGNPNPWLRLIMAVRGHAQASQVPPEVSAVLVDAYDPVRLGGTGVAADWEAAAALRERLDRPLILAGGLNPRNVGDAIRKVRPWAVDVSSGVEAQPGRKDARLLREFFAAVRAVDGELEAGCQ